MYYHLSDLSHLFFMEEKVIFKRGKMTKKKKSLFCCSTDRMLFRDNLRKFLHSLMQLILCGRQLQEEPLFMLTTVHFKNREMKTINKAVALTTDANEIRRYHPSKAIQICFVVICIQFPSKLMHSENVQEIILGKKANSI